ncbi:phage tail-collar fiber domain-containing protein [Vibrio sp. SCSIO 43086]|uniref:phage tail-collar fiber domain-containing protein n=1 Tax=Vibrio sp. SCSIO 43086 TaxID=2822845 RepID=UPI003DA9464D
MTDLVSQGVIITHVGEQILARSGSEPVTTNLASFGVGRAIDGYAPTLEELKSLTTVPGEWLNTALSSMTTYEDSNQCVVEGVIPADVGLGEWMRIFGLYTEAGELMYVFLYPEWERPSDGALSVEIPFKATLKFSDKTDFNVVINPSLVFATQAYVEMRLGDYALKNHNHDADYYLKHQVDTLNADIREDTFYAQGKTSLYVGLDAVPWDVKSGVYHASVPGSHGELVLHMLAKDTSTSAAQFRFRFQNGGAYYRSSRDQYGFEEGWVRLDNHEQFLHLWSSQTEHTLTRNGYSKAYLLVRKYSETTIRIDADSFKNDDEIVICNQIENAGKVTVVLETTRGAKIYAPDNTGHASVTITGRCKATFRVTGSNFYISSVTQ